MAKLRLGRSHLGEVLHGKVETCMLYLCEGLYGEAKFACLYLAKEKLTRVGQLCRPSYGRSLALTACAQRGKQRPRLGQCRMGEDKLGEAAWEKARVVKPA